MFTKTEHLTEQHQTKGGQIGYVRVGGRKGEEGYVDCIGWGESDSLFNVPTPVSHSGQSNVTKIYYICKDNNFFSKFPANCVLFIF